LSASSRNEHYGKARWLEGDDLRDFKLRGEISGIAVIAAGKSIRVLSKLENLYGRGRWRKLKGRALVELPDGSVTLAEIHWYEAQGIGRKDMKVKHLL
jgi:hypothetical protein